MLIVTIDSLDNMRLLGTVSAVCVMAGNIFKDTRENIRNIVGGEMVAYNEIIEKAIDTAFSRLQEKAMALGGDAIAGVRITSVDLTAGGAEIIIYGTAVSLTNASHAVS